MATYKLYYATNRNHVVSEGSSGTQFKPDGYGSSFSSSGYENLRFGKLSISAEKTEIDKYLSKNIKDTGTGDGSALAKYLGGCVKESAKITAYRETGNAKVLGSKAMFADLKKDMDNACDVLVYIHGFNVSWQEAVSSALSLQIMLNAKSNKGRDRDVVVVLFSWPSDGKMIPYASYRSDRADAKASAKPVGRGLLKMRDFLVELGRKNLCGQDIHLLCHSMGNYVLQNALAYMQEFNNNQPLPRLFEHVFLCAADVDDDSLEPDMPLAPVHQITRNVSIYHNKGDTALTISDYTKGQPERLGSAGAARPNQLHNKIHQVDCAPIVHGLVEHSYYLCGKVNEDIRASIDSYTQDAAERHRTPKGSHDNVWAIYPD